MTLHEIFRIVWQIISGVYHKFLDKSDKRRKESTLSTVLRTNESTLPTL